MKKLVFQFVACIAALFIAELLLPGIETRDYQITVIAGACLGVAYLFLRPLARVLLGIFNLFTLGLVGFILDAVLVYVLALLFPSEFLVENFMWAAAAAAIVDTARYLAGRAARK